ncbi:tetratricopeptide repeat protein [Fulvimonas soli]|uniref:Tetratricopeptide repeat protein n=1 Tax=Fulvimonas soli TaxID=155197 RepID=A0A316I2G7_9GAMM|nr:sulfotransferase [Fulvimonas soli]PWK87609.1 tetratricopeptide repeat protein [Fulvimonas soli]
MSEPAAAPPHRRAEPCLDGLPAAAVARLQAAARAIRDGDEHAARQALDAALGLAPEHPETLRLYGVLHLRRQRPAEAQAWLRRALARWPDYALAHSDLGTALQATGDGEAALASWRRACALAPDAPMPWFNLGRNLQQAGATAEAAEALQRAAALAPDLLPAQVLLGDALAHLGRLDEADARYRAALALHPACGDAWRGLANLKTRPLSADERTRLAGLLRRDDLAPPDRIALGFALGKACEDQGDYAAAFAALGEANAQQRRLAPWQAGAFHALVEAVRAADAALPEPADPALGREAIFIVGLPRSGSTLFEQILAAHPQVEGASELPDLPETLAEESRRRGQPFPQWLARASAADWLRLGKRYLERTARWRAQRPRHTDKLPENWLYAGLLRAMLPGARIVDARRDALEAGWSCYKQQFYRLPHFACALTDIAAYIRDYERAMDAWRAAGPARIRTQCYEALLADPEREIRALLDFCGLPFDPACLDFHRAERSVRTASAAQVRQPLRRDTARAERYGALLDPLRLGLGLPPLGG